MLVFMRCVRGFKINGSRILQTKAGIWLTPPHFLDLSEYNVSDTSAFDTSDNANLNWGKILLSMLLDDGKVPALALASLLRLVPMVEK